jgi:hypothetical protein
MGPALFDGLVVLKQDWVCQIDTWINENI